MFFVKKILENLRSFWNNIKNSKTSSNLPNSMSCEDKRFDEPLNTANLFSDYFSSAYKKKKTILINSSSYNILKTW